MILETTKREAIIINMGIVWVLDAKKVAYELSTPLAKVGAPQADNDSCHPYEHFI